MKEKNKRNRILALVLCMILIVSQNTFIFAGETVAAPEVLQEVSAEPTVTEAPAAPVVEEVPVATPEPTPEPVPTATEAPTPEPTAEPVPTVTEAPTPEPTAEPESGAVIDSAQGAASEATVENAEYTDSAGAVTDPAQGAANTAENTEETAEGTLESEETTSEGEEESEILSEETYTQVLNYEDEDVRIFVEAKTADAIPENASLKVVPIVQEDKKTEEQYKEVEEELQKKGEDEEYEIAGFLAYDITFIDADGNEIEPNGDVKVSMEYKKAVMPDAIDTNEVVVANLDVTVMNLDENDLGEIEVVDMVADETIEAEVKITENVEVEKAEFVIDDSEVYTLTWTNEVAEEVVEEEITQILTYEDEEVSIRVEATVENAIPEHASLKVVPVLSEVKETSEQYAEVEKQLQQKAENEAYKIAGFLAYDITFVDVDGNEIEPNGNVRVSMEYKKAVIPNEINTDEIAIENLDVTVMHLEENELGEVKEVVDMVTEEHIEAEVKTTENAEVEKAVFVTESFSTYTVTWTYKTKYKVILKPHYGYLSENGEFIEFENEPRKKIDEISTEDRYSNITLGEYANTNIFETGEYMYDRVYIVEGDTAFDDAISATQLRLHINRLENVAGLEYISSGNQFIELFSVNGNDSVCSIYYVYKTPPKPITTVDSKSEYINISVSDYSIWPSAQKKWGHTVQYDINNNHKLKFVTTGNELSDPEYNVYTGGQIPRQGFVNNNLAFGYPKLKVANESLDYLFSTGYEANYLFKKVDGYYVYDSAQNFASLDTSTGNFKVYSEPNKGFFPFNKFTEDLKIESANTSTVENHHLGMNVNFTFMQPKDGKTANNANMIFEFSGDDDVWVFIDGVLVLDLGGIHQPTGGTINFATGEVTYTNATSTTIYDMYVEALKEQGFKQNEAEKKAKTYFVEYETGKYRFKDYSQHELNFFYLERGAHDSNCMIKFNLLSIPENSISIEKEITESNMADFADAEFTFRIEKKNVDGNGNYPQNSTILANTGYKLYEVDSAGNRMFIENRKTNASGEFTLKHRQAAEFSDIPASTKYCVTEVGISSEIYDQVSFNGVKIENEMGQKIGEYSTGELLAQEYVYVKFQNKCNVANLRNLIIDKQMVEGQTSDETFGIKLEFKEGDEWVSYVGDYYFDSSTGEKKSTTNGIIYLVPNQSAYIIGLISGTEYRVTEVLNQDQQLNYGNPVYTGSGTPTETDVTGVIELKPMNTEAYRATVTNSLLKVVNVEKVWVDSETNHEPVYVGLYKVSEGGLTPYSADSYRKLTNDTWETTFNGLSGEAFDVRELVEITNQDQKSDFTIDGKNYIATNDNYSYGGYNYGVSYSKKVDQNVTNVTITNTRLGKIVIEKVSKSDYDLKLQGAEFKLQKFNAEKDVYEDYRTGTTDVNGKLTFDNLEKGKYQIVETKAPAGYTLSDETVIVELPKTENEVVAYEANVTIENEVLYDLPSTGSSGIYWYMIGGVFLMFAATLILYKNRRKEVLARYKY